jgi:outer membrane protein
MKRKWLSLFLVSICCLSANSAIAADTNLSDSIKNRLGINGRIGFIVPADSDALSSGGLNGNTHSDTGFIGGGGIIYGITDLFSAELDITHSSFGTNRNIDFDTTNISMGVQYRCPHVPIKHLIPYAGAGIDILVNGANNGLDVDTVAGIHMTVGVDYFVIKQLALTTEIKGVVAPNADITGPGGVKVGEFDPNNFSMTFGARYFFN